MPAVALAALSLAGLGCSSEGADGDGATDGGVTGDSTAAQPTQAAPTTAEVRPVALGEPSETYAEARNWLCRPDLADDACDVDLDATLVNADGSVELEPFRPAEDPVADCFYVYPTISGDPGENSDLEPDAAELGIDLEDTSTIRESLSAKAWPGVPAVFEALTGLALEETEEG